MPENQNDSISATISALTSEKNDLRIERDALKGLVSSLTSKLEEANVKIELDSREMMYPAIQNKFTLTKVELDAMQLKEVVRLRETASRVAVDAKPKGIFNSVFASSDAKQGGIPDLYGKTPEQIRELVSKL